MNIIGEIFYWVLNASILGAIAGLIVLLLRKVKFLPRFGVYLLWLLPGLRLWIPVGIANKYSLLNLLSQYVTKTIVVWTSEHGTDLTMTNSLQAAAQYFPIVYKTPLLKDIFNVAGFIWLIVAIAAILCSITLYFITNSALKDAEHLSANLYQSEKVISPAVYGILKPKIILPVGVVDTDLAYILKHEQLHVRRKDNLWRVIAVITACVHWFNPLCWLSLKYFFTDMELACDAGVLKKLPANNKKAYASALLACSSNLGKTYYASAFGGAKTRLRIEAILSYKKLTLLSILSFSLLFIVIALTIITNATG